MVILWGGVVMFAILTGVLLSGKGAFLIAGYNTSSAEEQAKYDEKKLCRVTGMGMLVITILMFIMALLGENMPKWFGTFFTVATLIDIAVLLYVLNTKCAVEQAGDVERKTVEKNGISRKVVYGISIVITVFVVVLLFTGDIQMQYGENSFTIKASYWEDKEIAYSDIESIEYLEDGKSGSRTAGFGSPRLQMGNFHNGKYGDYIRYCYTSCEAYVELTVAGKTVVVNGADRESTQAIYDALLERR